MESAAVSSFLASSPQLAKVVDLLNQYLEQKHAGIFGNEALHPVLPLRRSKVIHDALWGTVRFSWREMALIDSPILQRLRDVHQTGLAFQVYPSAHHSRFEHCLGAATIASRVFDALLHRQREEIRDLVGALNPEKDRDKEILRLKQELRLAALLHDTGHSLFSHTSERVYRKLDLLNRASRELSAFVGKEKGAGEVISFCVALTPAVARVLARAADHLIGEVQSDDYEGEIDLVNVALIIIGRSRHPFLQFLGDIVSSGFDADKLDYLLRDARTAGLPLTYDLDRYLYDVRIEKALLPDGKDQIKQLFDRIGGAPPERNPSSGEMKFPYYEAYRLRLSRRAMSVIEQIMICKMMLYSYIYHHGKVRASEGLLERLLNRCLDSWCKIGETDENILLRFMDMTDSCLRHSITEGISDEVTDECAYRLINRLVPRTVYEISGPSATHAQKKFVLDFLLDLHERGSNVALSLEREIGVELLKLRPELGPSPEDALARAGVWVDAPTLPSFEDVDDMVMGAKSGTRTGPVMQIFPIREWVHGYEHYRYQVRIFSFSEFWEHTSRAAKAAMQRELGIQSEEFYQSIRRTRE